MSFIFIHMLTISRTCLRFMDPSFHLVAFPFGFKNYLYSSLSVGLLVTHFFSFRFLMKSLPCLFFKHTFARYRNLGCWLFSPMHCLPCCLLTYTFPEEKPAVVLVPLPCLPWSAEQTLEHSERSGGRVQLCIASVSPSGFYGMLTPSLPFNTY